MQNTYAQALLKTIEHGTDTRRAVDSLKEILVRRNHLSLAPKIAMALRRSAERQIRMRAETALVASEKDIALAKGQHPNAEVVVDPTIIGGTRFVAKGHLVDASYKRHLLSLYRSLTH